MLNTVWYVDRKIKNKKINTVWYVISYHRFQYLNTENCGYKKKIQKCFRFLCLLFYCKFMASIPTKSFSFTILSTYFFFSFTIYYKFTVLTILALWNHDFKVRRRERGKYIMHLSIYYIAVLKKKKKNTMALFNA